MLSDAITLTPKQSSAIRAAALAQGLTPTQWLEHVLDKALPTTRLTRDDAEARQDHLLRLAAQMQGRG